MDSEESLNELKINDPIENQLNTEKIINRKTKKKLKKELERKKNFISTQKILSSLLYTQLKNKIVPSYESKSLISLLTSRIQSQELTKGNYLTIFKLNIDENENISAKLINSRPISGIYKYSF